MIEIVNVGVAQYKIAESPKVLRTILGSCVGICIYDRNKKIGGLAHILLPKNPGGGVIEKYADTCIPEMVKLMLKMGCKKEFMSAKIAGGASMFKFKSASNLANIGVNNVETTKMVLSKLGIKLLDEDIGGNSGRVLDFFLEDGRMKVKKGGEEKIYYKV